ncbi:MAG: dehydrogenase [Planctomycetaceae bacterium]|nr:dehydrogenase [Planctomycetaceae bacterium]
MSNLRLLLSDVAWPDTTIEQQLCDEAGVELVIASDSSEETLIGLAAGCDGIITCWADITEAVISASGKHCKVVSRMGIGLDNIDVDYCTNQGIPVTNVPDYCLQEVAEHTLASIYSLGRHINTYNLESKSGKYERNVTPPLRRLKGQTIGIIGLGNIGKRVVELVNALGFRVLGFRQDMTKTVQGVELVPFEDLISRSDFITLHLPLTDTNHHMIGAEEFKRMKSTAYLINTARGGLVDHSALATALKAGELAGAALDVQDPEPPDLNTAPYNDPRVIVTPHAAFVSVESLIELRRNSVRNALDILLNRESDKIVNL